MDLFVIIAASIFLLPLKSFSIDPIFLSCSSKSCGGGGDGPNIISFPFYIEDEQESYCGYPGFNVTCQNNFTILKLFDTDYIIHRIFYQNQSLLLSNAAFHNASSCFPPIRNFSFPDDRFMLPSDQTQVFLFYNCNSSVVNQTQLFNHKIDVCLGGDSSETALAMFGDDPLLGNASVVCEREAIVPVRERGGFGGEVRRAVESGFVMNWISSNCSACERSGGKCGFDETLYHFKCFCPDRPHAWECPSGTSKRSVIVATIGASVAGIGILLIAFCYFIRRKFSSNTSIFCWKTRNQDHQSIEAFLKNRGSLVPRRYRYSEIKKMTDSFKDKLGAGGFGGVFKGKLPDDRVVAVKVLKDSKSNGEDFINEVASISRTSHVNIVTLLGFCFEGSKRALVYEFMPNGSLEKYIYKQNPSMEDYRLSWETLHRIMVGVAQGLEYLHRGCNTRILHLDIKPHNVLLDENFCPKISDFGLAKICLKRESAVSILGARGTVGYIAPEVFCRNFGGVSHKSDVYSYGMLVLEMVGARQNICVEVDRTSEIYFPHWICKRLKLGKELGLKGIENEEENEIARRMILVSLWCIQTDPSNRPSMSRVVEMLQGSLDALPMAPTPYLSSPPRSPPRLSDSSISAMIRSSQN